MRISFPHLCGVAAIAWMNSGISLGQDITGQLGAAQGQAGVRVLTRGPVHEAFAETIMYDPEPGIVISAAPPQPIVELAPDRRPDGDNVDWIPGYWAWDDEIREFTWVSGVWRALPPGREWVPGYWGADRHGAQWTAGYWADAEASEIEYLPEPPQYVQSAPSGTPPSPDHTWMPGSWVWDQGRYAWRAGSWMTAEPDWDWIPAHYVWAPRGYVFVEGYWDHSISRRGVMYAPVQFDSSVYQASGLSYAPATVISMSAFSDHLFVRPEYNHYYFGDYYDPSYRASGYYASGEFQDGRHGYEPIYSHQRWQNRKDPEWNRRYQATFNERRDHEEARPRRTLAAQVTFSRTDDRRVDASLTLGGTIEQLFQRRSDGPRIQPVDPESHRRVSQRAGEVQRFRDDRRRTEHEGRDGKVSSRTQPIRVKAARSPISTRSVDRSGKADAPPSRPQAAKPDPTVERTAKQRAARRDENRDKQREPSQEDKRRSDDRR